MTVSAEMRLAIVGCSRFLSGHHRSSVKEALSALAAIAADDESPDMYGAGEIIESFEREIAMMLGKPSAVFMPSGTMAQQIALRIHCDRAGIASVAYHPTSHLEIHEQQGLHLLHGIAARVCGSLTTLMTPADLSSLVGPMSTLLVELPQREIGGALPSWSELEALCAVARERKMAVHLDGARLWQCEPHYGKSPAEISSLFDSVYVSFYKALGGIAGAVLAGESDFIAEAKLWQRRYGGNLVRLYPYVLSARAGLRRHFPKIKHYVERAQEIAEGVSVVPGVSIVPRPVVTNMMHVYIAAPPSAVEREVLAIASQEKVLICGRVRSCAVPNTSSFEVSIGEASDALAADEITGWFERLAKAR